MSHFRSYLANTGFPTSNSYYHMNETFVVAYNLSAHSEREPSLLCMHNFTDKGTAFDIILTRGWPGLGCWWWLLVVVGGLG